jgi:hypothetical protein
MLKKIARPRVVDHTSICWDWRSGMHLRDAMGLSEHRTAETALKYFQPGAALARGVGKLLEGLAPAAVDDDRPA